MGRGGDGPTSTRKLRSGSALAVDGAPATAGAILDDLLPERKPAAAYSAAEIARHCTPDDCWLIIKGNVYDVSGWGTSHPGGQVIYTYGGRDATDVFSAFHAGSTWQLLRARLIGACTDVSPELLQDFRRLRADMQAARLFESSKLYYAWKCFSNLAICASSLSILRYSSSYTALFSAAFLMALFWQQCGWLAHDFLHHQVFTNRTVNNAAGLFFGNFCQGFSVAWWKDKHNTHHAAPNELDTASIAVDPDIDTLPLLAWSADMLTTLTPKQRSIVRVQHILLFPVLLMARISWCLQSALFPFNGKVGLSKAAFEVASISGHYLWLLAAAFTYLSPAKAVLFYVMSQFFCGILLGFVFMQSHNGMEIYSDRRDFVSSQLASTRNIHSNLFNDWFTGGLNRQVEHHLFPTLPRHNLGQAQELIRAFCSKHGLYYENCSMSSATSRVLLRLVEVARLA